MPLSGFPPPVTFPAIAPVPVTLADPGLVAIAPAGRSRARPVGLVWLAMNLAAASWVAVCAAGRVVRSVTGASSRAWPGATATVVAPSGHEAPPDHWSR